jgi:hypothetical protein
MICSALVPARSLVEPSKCNALPYRHGLHQKHVARGRQKTTVKWLARAGNVLEYTLAKSNSVTIDETEEMQHLARFVATLLLFLFHSLAVSAHEIKAGDLVIVHAMVGKAEKGQSVQGSLEIRNEGKVADKLLSIHSKFADQGL